MTETVRVPYEKFKEFVVESRENGTQKRMLSLEEESRGHIPEREKSESSGRDEGIAEKTWEVYGRPFPEMERKQADHRI